MTPERALQIFKYLPSVKRDMDWGLVVSCVGYQSTAPGQAYPPAGHPASYNFEPSEGRILDEFQLVFYASGEGTFHSDSAGEARIKEGDLMMLFPGERHSYYPDEDKGWEEYWIGFKGPNIDSRVSHGFFSPTNPIYTIAPEMTGQLLDIFTSAIRVAQQMGKGYQQLLAGYVNMLLGHISYAGTRALQGETNDTSDIQRAMIFIHNNYKRDLHPEQVSEYIGWGYSRFRKVFLQQTGTTPYQYIQEVRIEQSKHLLLNTRKALKEIAYDVGFSSPDYFSTAFRRIVGMSPLAFRKR